MNWHIGQRIVAVRTHRDGAFNKGDEFTIKALKTSHCSSKYILVDVGIPPIFPNNICAKCRTLYLNGGVWWFASDSFRPLDDLSNHTADSLMEEMDKNILITI